MVLGGPGDDKLSRQLRDVAMHRFIDLSGRVDLLTAFACLKRARLFIGNDSGAMHLAAASGCPTIGLFGPSDERLYAPWGEHTRVVRGPRSYEQIREVDPGFTQALCHMMDLSVDTVLAAAKDLLKATEPQAQGQDG
jgi:ADP-heptose:LPS heptosyltransferase